MAKGENQKLKLLYLLDILNTYIDDEHPLTMQEIVERLSEYGVNAERKTLYNDMEELRKYGADIIGRKDGQSYSYRIGSREFELAELKLLVDAVQSSRFITRKKSQELIRKIEGLTSIYQAKEFQVQVFVAQRIKTMNESIYYNIDLIYIPQSIITGKSSFNISTGAWIRNRNSGMAESITAYLHGACAGMTNGII